MIQLESVGIWRLRAYFRGGLVLLGAGLVVAGLYEDLETGGILAIILVEIFALFGLVSWVQQARTARRARALLPGLQRPGVVAMETGDYTAAAEYFEKTAATMVSAAPDVAATLAASAASAWLRAGNRQKTRDLLLMLIESGWPGKRDLRLPLGTRVFYTRAFLEALEGNVEEAAFFQERVMRVLPPRLRPELRVGDVVIHSRKNNHEAALEALKDARRWQSESVSRTVLLDILEAFLTQQPLLAKNAFQVITPEKMVWLWTTWPELSQWLVSESLL